MVIGLRGSVPVLRLNESPSEKEGKLKLRELEEFTVSASMKVPPKRKGNARARALIRS